MVVGLAGLWLAMGVLLTSASSTRAATSSDEAADILAALLAIVVLGGFVGAAGAALQSFYLSSDLPFLLSLPVPLRATFGAKLLDAMAGVSPVAVVLVAVLSGYGLARSERWWFVAVAAFVGISVLIASTALAVLVVATIGRLLPPRRTGHVLGLVSLLLIVVLWAVYAAIAPDVAARETAGGETRDALGLALATAGDRVSATPLDWAGRALVNAGEGSVANVILYTALTAGATLGLVGAALAAFVATFAHAYGGYRLTSISLRRPDRPLARWVATILAPLPMPLAALVLKEWLTMFRDLRRLSGAIWPLGMVGIYTILLSRDTAAAPAGAPGLAFWLSCGTLALVPWGASLGISIYAFGSEGRRIQLLRSLPLAPRTLLLGKVLASLVLVLVVSESAAIIVGSMHGASPGQYLSLLGLVAWAATGYVLIDTAASAIAPNFEAEHVQRSTGFAGRIIGFAAGTVFTIASAAATIRLIFFSTGVPVDLRTVVGWEIGGVEPLGWPLVVAAAAIAVLDVALFVGIACSRVAIIVRDGE